MEGFPPSFMEEDDNMTWNQLLSPAPEVPVNQGSILCNDQGGQNNVINDSIQQTTQFPPSFPETMTGHGYMTPNATTSQHGEFNQPGPSSPAPWYQPNPNLFDPQCANPMVPGPSMPLRDQQWTDYQLPIMSNQVPAMLPGPQPPLNQWHQNSFIHQPQKGHGYMTPNATTSQHGGFNQSGPSFPAPRIQFLSNQGQDDQAAVIPDIDNMQQENFVPRNSGNSTSLPPEVPDNQSSISLRINQNEPNWPQTPSRYLPHPNLSDPRCANPMLPGPSMPLRDQQWTNYQLPMRNQVPAMLPGPQPPLNQWHQYSNIHQPQPGHAYMTPNATTSEHGGFIQPGPSFPAPRSQYFSNQGQVDPAAVIPNIDNVQQENFVPGSQMDNLQVRGLQNQTAMPNASNPGLDTSLQSQNRGLNTQQVEMGGSNDSFRNYVEERADGSLKCKFCPHTYATKTSISRIKWHLSREEGHGVSICRGVAKEVQEAAWKAMCRGNKRLKSTESSINVNDSGISTCPQEQNIEIENMGGGIGRVQREVQVEPGVGEERITSHAIAGNDVVSMTRMRAQEDGVSKGALESRPRTEPVDRSLEQSNAVLGNLAGAAGRIQVGVQGMLEQGAGEERINRVRVRTEPVEEDVENSRRSVQVGAGSRSSESLKYNKTRGVPLPTSSTKPVGQAFEEKTKEIWSLLMDDKVPTIGIYGMGGIGKTTILKHIYNELIQRPDICDHVWWVTVSQDFSINRLQNLIAEHLDLDLSRKNDDLHRAAKLSEELRKKQKWILILDDLWNNFELHKVGIPEKLEGCKLIMTTRSETVCHQMACQHKIKVKPLSNGEAWTLFMKKLQRDVALSPEVKGIAKAVARECAGLPLGIITVAGSLRGVDDLHEWRNTLNKLRESEFTDNEVFKLLRFSYDRLSDLALQQCLLYCALFPEDDEIEREELIGYLIDEGIIKGKRSRGDAFDEGHTMLNRLENVCLLESAKLKYDDIRRVKMHDMIRDMAIRILLENSQGMVKAGAQLKELPDAEEWSENLTRVSLRKNMIEEIPSSHSPRCPYLSTLLLCQNLWLGFIADSFFKQLHGLKVLDLSWTHIGNLPDSVSDLVSLTALLLNHCEKLRRVPSLEKLQALKRLSLSYNALEKIPQGLECLTNLRYLRMNGCGEKEFPSGILPKLSHLQVFVLEEFMTQDDAPITVKGKEVGSLRNLETLECHFEGFSDFVEYLKSRDGILSLCTCKILVGKVFKYLEQCMEGFPSKTVALGNLSINGDKDFQVKLLNGIQRLVCQCIDARSLCDVLSLENATELERIFVWECHNMESLVSSSWFCSAPPRLPSCNGTFSGLKELFCHACKSMKKLFPPVLLPNLVNLERIRVSFCEKMEEIIGTTDEESSTSNSITEVILPKLRTLKLYRLPELKSICSAKLICNSLEVSVKFCEKLKRMPICLPLLENGQPSPPPSLKKILASPR